MSGREHSLTARGRSSRGLRAADPLVSGPRRASGGSILEEGATVFEETATGTGAFTNTSGFVSVSSIDYTTGAVSVTFTSAPDNLTVIEILTNFGGNSVLGGY